MLHSCPSGVHTEVHANLAKPSCSWRLWWIYDLSLRVIKLPAGGLVYVSLSLFMKESFLFISGGRGQRLHPRASPNNNARGLFMSRKTASSVS